MPNGKGKEEAYKPLDHTVYFVPKKVTKGAVQFVETTAGGAEKKTKGLFRTLYIRHDMPAGLPHDEDGNPICPNRLKVTISEE